MDGHAEEAISTSSYIAEALSTAAQLPLNVAAAAADELASRARHFLPAAWQEKANTAQHGPLVHEDSGQMRQAARRQAFSASNGSFTDAAQPDALGAGDNAVEPAEHAALSSPQHAAAAEDRPSKLPNAPSNGCSSCSAPSFPSCDSSEVLILPA